MKKQLFLTVFIFSQILFGCEYDRGEGLDFPEQITYNSTFVNGNKSIDERYKGLYLLSENSINANSEKERRLILKGPSNNSPTYVLLEPSIQLEKIETSRNNYKMDLKAKNGKYYKILWRYSRHNLELKFSGSVTNLNDEIGGNYILFTHEF